MLGVLQALIFIDPPATFDTVEPPLLSAFCAVLGVLQALISIDPLANFDTVEPPLSGLRTYRHLFLLGTIFGHTKLISYP